MTDSASLYPVGPVAPGQLLTLFGNGMAGAKVTFDGVAAPPLYSSDGQINVQAPFEIAPRASTVMTVSAGSNVLATRRSP